jgi:hypothetical protein
MCLDGHLDAEQINKLFTWVNSNSSLGNGYIHRVLIMFQYANKGNYDLEFDAAEAQYGKIQNMRKLYRCL